MRRLILAAAFSLLVAACTSDKETSGSEEPVAADNQSQLALVTDWMFYLDIGQEEALPFNLSFLPDSTAVITNGDERIPVKDVRFVGDSIFIQLPIFDANFKGEKVSDSLITGAWHNLARGSEYVIPFRATASLIDDRFPCFLSDEGAVSYPGPFNGERWEATFSAGQEDEYKAIGIFNMSDDNRTVTGTFITETGDYRFLEGGYCGGQLRLSCFDGSHAFLFTASLSEDGSLDGSFYSGNHWEESWVAVPNDSFTLTNPYELTYLNEGYENLSFTFPDLDSSLITYPDESYNGSVTLIQIMGSWCPNCMDETKVLAELYDMYADQGLKIISLCYEKATDFTTAARNVSRLKDHFGAQYDFLIAGAANKKLAAESLPMLNHVMSFPTLLFIDKSGVVRKVHTGFYGPGTGDYYTQTMTGFRSAITQLLAE